MGMPLLKFEEHWQECCACGTWFATSKTFNDNKIKSKSAFYCPNGHSLSYTENEADRLRIQIRAKEQELSRSQQTAAMERQLRIDTEAKLAQAKKESGRIAKRINAGVCPHCNRTFQQLARHMKCKHEELT